MALPPKFIGSSIDPPRDVSHQDDEDDVENDDDHDDPSPQAGGAEASRQSKAVF